MGAMLETVDAFVRQIKRRKIEVPGSGQYVDRCHYSKTGWAIWNADGACTCRPAKAPHPPQEDKE